MSQQIRYSKAWTDEDKATFNTLRRETILITEELKLAAEQRKSSRPTPQLARRVHGLERSLQTAKAIMQVAHRVDETTLTLMLSSLRGTVQQAKGQISEREGYLRRAAII